MDENRLTFEFDQETPQRLDKFLVACLPEISRSRIQALIKDNHITIDGHPPRKSGQILEKGNLVNVHLPILETTELTPENIPLQIVYENDDLLVIDKPAGMVVHPAVGHTSGTLVHAALAHAPEIEAFDTDERPGIVHRLDKDTSGLILVAKNEGSHRWLQDQFRLRKVQKTYLALVDGQPPTPVGRIEAPIGRDSKSRKKMAVVSPAKGRQAISEYSTVEVFEKHTLLEVVPVTGRTHQIRLHLAFLGCPVAGDTVYGYRKPTLPIKRHFLHAAQLKIRLQGEKEERIFSAPLPAELEKVLVQLRSSS